MSRLITISDGNVVKVDAEDFIWLTKWKWSANGNGYAVRNERYEPKKYRKQYMHRAIIGASKGEIVDHVNGDRLDNRKENLRICDLRGNARNSTGKPNHRMYSRYKGVTFDKARLKFIAQIGANGKNFYLGGFDKEEDAARAYNEAALKHHGEYARLNDLKGDGCI